ncbi:hypothetical protein TL16_g08608 [Triparma laevis f. inornata]|uniref:PDZ domain-containing protein n=1 Tax=Triparma laevis f. inornata TaxID=1714386 RepID=A0A9W7AX44_9STRA|nr:hypothetical protein TL16_g08608 [Triparma laevis f. inornata]
MGIFGTLKKALGLKWSKPQKKDLVDSNGSTNGEVEQTEQVDIMDVDVENSVEEWEPMPPVEASRNGLSDEWIIENMKGEDFEILEITCTTKYSSLGIVIRVRSKQMVVISEEPTVGGEGEALGLEKGDVIVEIANEPPREWLPGVKEQLKNAARPYTMKLCRFKGKNGVLTEVLQPLLNSPGGSGRVSPRSVRLESPRKGKGRPRKTPLPISPETQLAIMVAANAGGNTPGRKKVSAKSLKSAKKKEAKQVASKAKHSTKKKSGKKK